MGGIGKVFKGLGGGGIFGKVLGGFAKLNPLAGAAISFVGGMLKGQKPMEALFGAAKKLIPGGDIGGLFKNVLGKFGGGKLMEGLGGNSFLNAAFNLATGKGKVTDILKDLFKATEKKEAMTDQSRHNVTELTAKRMSQLMQLA